MTDTRTELTPQAERQQDGSIRLRFPEESGADKSRFEAELAAAEDIKTMTGHDVWWLHNGVRMETANPSCSWALYTELSAETGN